MNNLCYDWNIFLWAFNICFLFVKNVPSSLKIVPKKLSSKHTKMWSYFDDLIKINTMLLSEFDLNIWFKNYNFFYEIQ
jgi:hypothetical protein